MKTKRTTEDYLKTIYLLAAQGDVHAAKIARALNVSRPTVSVALKALTQEGYVWVDEGHCVQLTEQGMKIARETYARNQFFQDMLMRLGVDRETAAQDACQLEHSISPKSFEALRNAFAHQMKIENQEL